MVGMVEVIGVRVYGSNVYDDPPSKEEL